MGKTAGFQVNRGILTPGIYLSRIGGDIAIYDVRLRESNTPPFLLSPTMHTMEYLLATTARDSVFHDWIVYFGSMGCRTGFCSPTKDMKHSGAIALMKDIFAKVTDYPGKVPGCTSIGYGNYLEHDLEEARQEAAAFLPVIPDWTEQCLTYPI